MEYRLLGRTGFRVSRVSFGAWAIGGTWGPVDDAESLSALHRALDCGVNFFDTADVYGDGHSERLLARLRKERKEPFYVATKAGRRLARQSVDGYSRKNLTRVDRAQLEKPRNRGDRSAPAALPADRPLLRARGFRLPRRSGNGGQNSPLRRERRTRGRSAESDRVSRRPIGADHLQRVPPAAGRALLARGGAARGRRAGAAAAGLRSARGQAYARPRALPPTTTAASTVAARRSIAVRPSPASITSWRSSWSNGCARWCRRACRWRAGRCAGS